MSTQYNNWDRTCEHTEQHLGQNMSTHSVTTAGHSVSTHSATTGTEHVNTQQLGQNMSTHRITVTKIQRVNTTITGTAHKTETNKRFNQMLN